MTPLVYLSSQVYIPLAWPLANKDIVPLSSSVVSHSKGKAWVTMDGMDLRTQKKAELLGSRKEPPGHISWRIMAQTFSRGGQLAKTGL